MFNQNQKYYFLHILKTAGTSFSSEFDKLFTLDEINLLQTWYVISKHDKKKEEIEKMYNGTYKHIRGHFANNDKITKDRFVFSFFRNQITRTLSQIKHIQH